MNRPLETVQLRPIKLENVGIAVRDLDEALDTAARHSCHPLRGVATDGDVYKLTCLRGPSGILLMLAEGSRSAH
jgi:glyoxylase I family protein